MKKGLLRAFVALLMATSVYAQQVTTTPNVGLQIPNYNTSNWQVPMNFNTNLLDKIFGGTVAIPALTVSGTLTAPNINITSSTVTNSLGYIPLNPANNLSDLANKQATLANLGAIGTNSYQGSWSNTSTYKNADLVNYQGSSYISLVASNTGNTPSGSSTYWGLIAQGGSSGSGGTGNSAALANDVFTTGLNVADYGASPTASATQNSNAFDAVLSAAAASGYGRVHVGPGVYKLIRTLSIPTKVSIDGTGRGDCGNTGGGLSTCLQMDTSFPAATPLVQNGAAGVGSGQFGSRISNMALSCNNVTGGIGLDDEFSEEQSGGDHLVIVNCAGNSLRWLGADYLPTNTYNGSSQTSGGYTDLEVFPGTAATLSTVPVLLSNIEGGRGLENVSVVPNQSYPVNYAIIASGNNFGLHNIHIEASKTAGILLGPGGTPIVTVGATNIDVVNVVGSTGVTGPVVEIASGAQNAPAGIIITGAQGGTGCGSIQDDFNAKCGYSQHYETGGQSNGSMVTWSLGYGVQENLHNPFQDDFPVTLYADTANDPQLELKSSTSPFNGTQFHETSDGTLHLGGQHGAKDLALDVPYAKLCLDVSDNCNGLNIQGSATDSSNAIFSGFFQNVYWDHATSKYIVPGNGSRFIAGLVNINPSAPNTPSASGGIGIFAANNVAEPTTLNQPTLNSMLKFLLYPEGGMAILNGNSAVCDAAHRSNLTIVTDTSNQNDVLKYCGYLSGNLGWITGGTSTGGGGGGTTPTNTIASSPVGTGPGVDGSFLQLQNLSGTETWVPTAAATVSNAGTNGVCINSSTGVPYPCPTIRAVSGTTDTITANDCGNAVVYTSSSAVTAVIAQPTQSFTAKCSVTLTDEGVGGITVNASSSTFGGTATSLTIPTGGTATAPKFVVLGNDGTNFHVLQHN